MEEEHILWNIPLPPFTRGRGAFLHKYTEFFAKVRNFYYVCEDDFSPFTRGRPSCEKLK